MKHTRSSDSPDILPAGTDKGQIRRFYDRVSSWYDFLAAPFEGRLVRKALQALSVKGGERVLEIGPGTGHALKQIARRTGRTGSVHGLDISIRMLQKTAKRLCQAGLLPRAHLVLGDAARMPYREGAFDAVFMSYTLELFDTKEIQQVLAEIRRVLRKGGRLTVLGMSREDRSWMLRLYECAHMKWPRYLNCRPIYLKKSLQDAGYHIARTEKARLFGIPNEIVVGVND